MYALTVTQEKVLKALATYRYLTVAQMMRLGVAGEQTHLYEVLKGLQMAGKPERKPKEIGAMDYGVAVGEGRLPRVYYLTKKGAQLLQGAWPEADLIRYVERPRKVKSLYWHTLQLVDCHIAFRKFAEGSGHHVRWFRSEFDYTARRDGPPRSEAQTVYYANGRKGTLVPDAVTVLDSKSGSELFLAIEVARGTDTGRVEHKIMDYCRALADETAWSVHGIRDDTDIRVLFVFEEASLLEAIIRRMHGNRTFYEWRHHFFGRLLKDVVADSFCEDWQRFGDREQTDLFETGADAILSIG